MGRQPIIACYDLPTVGRFFRSVALSIAMQRLTKLRWETYRDSAFINGLYKVVFWMEPPGTAEVKIAEGAPLRELTDELQEKYMTAWLTILFERGPVEGANYVRRMAELRDYSTNAVKELIHEARAINNAVLGETETAIARLATIRLVASVGVTVIGASVAIAAVGAAALGAATGTSVGISVFGIPAGASALTFTGLNTAYSVTTAVAKTWEGASQADVVAVSPGDAVQKELIKTGISEGAGAIAGKRMTNAVLQEGASNKIIAKMMDLALKQSRRLREEALRNGQIRKTHELIGRYMGTVDQEAAKRAAAQKTALTAAAFARAVPVVFAGIDIWSAVSDYKDTMSRLGR
jgi:hypothetical protein